MGIKISVITAVFNSVNNISNCIASVAEQTYSNIEHVVIDGGSVDGTLEFLKRHEKNLAVLISEPDNGIYDALNKGLLMSGGDVVGFLHADDVYYCKETLERVASAFEDPLVSAVYGDLQYIKNDDSKKVVRYWKSSPYNPQLLKRGWMPPHPTLYVRRDWYKKIGGFDVSYKISADYFSIIKLYSQPEFLSFYMPEVLVKMRLGGVSNRSLGNILLKMKEDLVVLQRTGIGGLHTLMLKNISKLYQFF